MLARPRFTCLGTATSANRCPFPDVTRLYRPIGWTHVTQQSAGRVGQVSTVAVVADYSVSPLLRTFTLTLPPRTSHSLNPLRLLRLRLLSLHCSRSRGSRGSRGSRSRRLRRADDFLGVARGRGGTRISARLSPPLGRKEEREGPR